MNQQTENIEAFYRTNLVLWAAMLISQFLFLLVVYFVQPQLFNLEALTNFPAEIHPGVYGLAFVSLTTLVMSFVLKSVFLKQSIDKHSPALVQTAQILAYSLCEAVSLFGVVTAFAFQFRYFFVFFAAGMIGILLHFPRRESFQSASFRGL